MPKASRVLAALKRDGWVETRRSGSHRTLEKNGVRRTWAFHDVADLGNPMLSRIAKAHGYTMDELRRIL